MLGFIIFPTIASFSLDVTCVYVSSVTRYQRRQDVQSIHACSQVTQVAKSAWVSKALVSIHCNSVQYSIILVSFPGPRPASRRLQYGKAGEASIILPYCKRREAGRGPGNEANIICFTTSMLRGYSATQLKRFHYTFTQWYFLAHKNSQKCINVP